MSQCQRCQRVVKRGSESEIISYRCINSFSKYYGQLITLDMCNGCDTKVQLQAAYRQREVYKPRKKSTLLSLEEISETAKKAAQQVMKGVPRKERCC